MVMFLVFLMIAGYLWSVGFCAMISTRRPRSQEITYDKFLEMLEIDEIASVEDTGATLEDHTEERRHTRRIKVTYYTGKMDDEGLLPLMREKRCGDLDRIFRIR